VRRCLVRAMYLSASVVAVYLLRGAIASARPLPLPLYESVPASVN